MINEALIDYHKCREYARILCGTYGIPECDVEDVGSDAFLLSIRRAWRAAPGENEEAVARRLMYTSVVDIIRRRKNRNIRALSDAEELYRTSTDDTQSDDDVVEERFAANDRGETEERMTTYLDWQNPFWLRLFDSERQKLRNEKRKAELRVIRLGLKDSRLRLVREKLKFSGLRFQTILDILKDRFGLCFQALRVWRG